MVMAQQAKEGLWGGHILSCVGGIPMGFQHVSPGMADSSRQKELGEKTDRKSWRKPNMQKIKHWQPPAETRDLSEGGSKRQGLLEPP
jgi:hypothetical protein